MEGMTDKTGPEVVASLGDDALADRFFKTAYHDGGLDVLGEKAGCAYFASDQTVTISRPYGKGTWHGWTREEARELRDALDVLLRATAASGEVAG